MSKNKVGIIVQARTGSTRLKQKMLLPFGNSDSLLKHILSSLQTNLNYPIVLATSTNSNDRQLAEIAQNLNIETYFGSENDVLKRFIEATNKHSFDVVVRVCADNPFLDPHYIDELIDRFLKSDYEYLSFKRSNGTPVMKSHIGFFAEVLTAGALVRANELTDDTFYHEHVTNFVYENPEKFQVGFLPVPKKLDRDDYRLTLDTLNDYQLLNEVEAGLLKKYSEGYNAQNVVQFVLDNHYSDKMLEEIKQNTK